MDNSNTPGLVPNEGDQAETVIGTLPAPELDPADYLPDMESFDMDEAQKIALLETLWSIMRSIVETGVDIKSVDPCVQIFGAYSADAKEGVASDFSDAALAPAGRNKKKKEDTPL